MLARLPARHVLSYFAPILVMTRVDPVSLAEHLLQEVHRGYEPVWPTTLHYARIIVAGLEELAKSRPNEVFHAITLYPRCSVLEWNSLLAPLFEAADGSLIAA